MKKRFKFKERYYKLNNKLTLIDGMFDHNPFYGEVKVTRASLWVLNNKRMVINKIYKELKRPGVSKLGYGTTPEDVYLYILDTYLTSPERDFQVNYFGEGSGYNIARYVLSNVRYHIQAYINKDDLSVSKVGVIQSIVPDSEEYMGTGHTVRSSYTKGSEDNYEWMNEEYYLECFEYLASLATGVWVTKNMKLTVEQVYFFFFHSLLGISEGDYLKMCKQTPHRHNKLLTSLGEDPEVSEDIKKMLVELSGPVSMGDFGIQHIEGKEFDLGY